MGAKMVRRFYLDFPHGQVHGRISQRAHAPWIVLLHQSPSSSIMFEALMAALSETFSVIAPDNPGFGQSDPLPKISMEAFSDVVGEVLDAHNITKAHVFGHHTGAAIGVNLAVRRRALVRSLALCGPPVLSDAQRASLPAMAPVEPLASDGSHLLKMWARLRMKETTAPPEISTREIGLAFSSGCHTRNAYEAVAAQDFTALLKQVTQPMFIFAGERDSLASSMPYAIAATPLAVHKMIPDAGGYICEMKPDLVADLLTKFFNATVQDAAVQDATGQT